MADVKITGLPTSSALDGSEVVPIVQAGTTKQATVNQIVTKVDSYTKTESDSALSLKQDKLAEGDFVDGDKTKLDGIEASANKYVLPADVVQDASYVHTDNNYTTTEKNKLSEAVISDTTTIPTGSIITNMFKCTQAEYDGITPDANTFYIIVG